jgi:hypothetical protein
MNRLCRAAPYKPGHTIYAKFALALTWRSAAVRIARAQLQTCCYCSCRQSHCQYKCRSPQKTRHIVLYLVIRAAAFPTARQLRSWPVQLVVAGGRTSVGLEKARFLILRALDDQVGKGCSVWAVYLLRCVIAACELPWSSKVSSHPRKCQSQR